MRLVIPDIPRSPNGPKGLLRMHWAAKNKYNLYWYQLVRSMIDMTAVYPTGRQKVSISQMRRRMLDPDNLVASVKPILDALVKWELIEDDDAEHIELQVTQAKGKEKITIIDIEPL